MDRKKTLVIDGKEYTVVEDVSTFDEARIVLESTDLEISNDMNVNEDYTERNKLVKFIEVLLWIILSPIRLSIFGFMLFSSFFKVLAAWVGLKIGLTFCVIAFFLVFTTWLRLIPNEQATEITNFVSLNLLGFGMLVPSKSNIFIVYPQVEWSIIAVVTIITAIGETRRRLKNGSKYSGNE